MEIARSGIVLVIVMFAVATTLVEASPYYSGSDISEVVCARYTCGPSERCSMRDGRPVCLCYDRHTRGPLVRLACQIDDDCPSTKICDLTNKCVDPCIGRCGANTYCQTKRHVSGCACLPGYSGNPFYGCQLADPQAACKPNPCGANTRCEVRNGRAACTCLSGYLRTLSNDCRHECERDSECPPHLACSANFKCESPCNKCGEGANCDVINHQLKCSCPNNWLGNPYSKCRPECTHHSECPVSKPACLYETCTNPCEGFCGVNANCDVIGTNPVCRCPKHMTGNPYLSCTTHNDVCKPNPCGANAQCTPNRDRYGIERAVCSCPTGYVGNASECCTRGECVTNSECPANQACINFFCQNPCIGKDCGTNARCEARQHLAVCTCLTDYRGNANYGCYRYYGDRRNFGYQNYYRR